MSPFFSLAFVLFVFFLCLYLSEKKNETTHNKNTGVVDTISAESEWWRGFLVEDSYAVAPAVKLFPKAFVKQE